WKSTEDRRMLRVHPDGRTELLAVNVGKTWNSASNSTVTVNPLDRLSPADIHRLRGVSVETWSPAIAAQLKHVNFEEACIRITENATGPDRAFPELPDAVRYLVIEIHSNMGIKDYSGLARLKALRCLAVENSLGPRHMPGPIDCAWLQAADLRYLRLFGAR